MKKIFCIVLTVAALVSLIGCSVPVADTQVRLTGREAVFSEAAMSAALDAFMGDGENSRKDRTSFGEGEKKAAEYLKGELAACGYSEENGTLAVQNFTVDVTQRYTNETQKLESQNVIAVFNPGREKNVVVGAYYDNLYSQVSLVGLGGTAGEGVFKNATGVTVLLELAKAFSENAPAADFTVYFAFFGASEAGVVGSSRFVTEYLKEVKDVLLMINLDGIAGGINIYSDEVDTVQADLFAENGANYETDFSVMKRSIPLYPQSYADNLSYSHYGLIGDHVTFFEREVPVVNLFGGKVDGFSYYKDKPDSLTSFKSEYAGYGKTMADTAGLVYDTLCSDTFVSAAAAFRTEKFDYGFFTGSIYAQIAFIGLIVLIAAALIFIVKHFEKKYPFKPVIKKLKIAVFGMEYEQNTDNDIYVDIRQAGNNPFPEDKNDIDPFK